MGLLIARHGETNDNERGILSGHRQIGLSAQGRRQAAELGMLLHDVPLACIYSSDLCRAVETAHIVGWHTTAPIQTTPLLRERYGGSITGMHRDAVDWTRLPHDVEPDDMILQRAFLFLEYLSAHQGSVLVIGHEGVNKALVSLLTGCSLADARRYACISQHCGIDYFPLRMYCENVGVKAAFQ